MGTDRKRNRSRVGAETTLKGLKTRKSKVDAEITLIQSEIENKKKEFNNKKQLSNNLKAKIENLNEEGLIISEHAILRYIERVIGLDMEELKAKILDESIVSYHRELGNGVYPLTNTDKKAVIKNNTIVTIH